jgi:beta-lactamase class D
MYRHLLLLVALAFTLPAAAEDPTLAALLARHELQGSMVITSLHSGQSFVHDDSRADQRFTVASTFKILNTLIALQEGVVADKDSRFIWDGQMRSIASWNQDQTLESAFQRSCVWCYQQLAEKIGAQKYSKYLLDIGFGQLKEPFDTTTFWLDGSLQISAREQVAFLKQLYQRSLPFSPNAYDTLQAIMQVEKTAGYRLYAKSGLAGGTTPKIGWYVGYVQTAEDVWFFATNLDIHDDSQLPLRLSVTREALQAKGVLP